MISVWKLRPVDGVLLHVCILSPPLRISKVPVLLCHPVSIMHSQTNIKQTVYLLIPENGRTDGGTGPHIRRCFLFCKELVASNQTSDILNHDTFRLATATHSRQQETAITSPISGKYKTNRHSNSRGTAARYASEWSEVRNPFGRDFPYMSRSTTISTQPHFRRELVLTTNTRLETRLRTGAPKTLLHFCVNVSDIHILPNAK